MAIWCTCINSEKKLVKEIFLIISKKIIVRYKKISYNIDVLRQTACLVVKPIKVNSFAYLGRSGLRLNELYHRKPNLRVTRTVGD